MPPQQTVTIAQALASSQSGLLVADTAANIAASLPDPALVARVARFSLSANAVITAAAADRIATLGPKFARGASSLTVQDSVAAMNNPANAAGLALASSRLIADAAYNLLAAPAGSYTHVSAVTLIGAPTLSMAELGKLETLPGFSVQPGAHVTLQDSLADIVPVLSAHPGWFVTAAALSIRLDGSQIGAYGVNTLAALVAAGRTVGFTAGGADTMLDVTASAHDLAGEVAALNRIAGIVGLHIAVSNDGSAVSAADAAALTRITGFSPAAHRLYVSDTGPAITANAAGLFAKGFPEILVNAGNFTGTAAQLLDPTLHLGQGTTVALQASATVTALQAQMLGALPGFALANGASLAVSDTVANILAHASGLSAATSIAATAPATVNAPGAIVLAVLATAHPGHFSLGGHALTVSDTAANLASLPPASISLATAFSLSGPGTVSASQFSTLRDTLHVALDGHALILQDSAANLLGLSGSLALASTCELSGPAVVNASGAQTLAAEPEFSTAGYRLTITDNAANLLALAPGVQAQASFLTLAAPQSVTAAQLSGLTGLGAAFSTGGHALTVDGNVTDLTALLPAQLALIHAAVLSPSASVPVATAQLLAALPGFAVANGSTLTVQDSAANLLTLSGVALADTGVVRLDPGAVALTAAQAAGLGALSHFSASGSTITVADSVANLNANAGWQAIAAATQVVDTAAILAANAGSALVQAAHSVLLAGDATVTAVQAVSLAGIAGFSAGGHGLTAADGAAAIAQDAAAILTVGATADVIDTGPVNCAQAEALAGLSSAGKLVFSGGDQLTVADSFANLTDPAYSAGVALADSITVSDTGANLVTASGHDWGNKVPAYVLSADSLVTGAQATALAALGAHFGMGGHVLSVTDSTANVLAAAPALTALNISATALDSAANIGSHVAALQSLGSALTAVQTNDVQPVAATTAAALSPLAGKLTGTLPVTDNAANVDGNVAALATLGAHAAITVQDSAASIGGDAAALATVGGALTVSLTDQTPVTAGIAANLTLLAANMANGTALAITDSAANIAAHAASLVPLNASLGTMTLIGGNGATVAQAAAIQPLDTHLGNGVALAVTGNAAAIAGNETALLQLQGDHRLASLTDAGDSAADVAAQAAALNATGASVTIADTEAAVTNVLGALAGVTGLTGITLSDAGQITFSLSIGQFIADQNVLALVTNTHGVAILDSAAAIEADLASAQSVIAGIAGPLSISTIGGATLVLPQSVALSPSVSAVLPDLTVPLQITGVDVAHLGAAVALSPASVTITDTAAHIQADLASGNPALVQDIASLAGITIVPSGTVTLTAAQALAAHVDDGAHSVFGLMSGATLDIANAGTGQLSALLALHTPPAFISVSDTAANIEAALADPTSAVLTLPGTIVSLFVNDGQTVVLTEAQDLAAGVNDGAHAALSKIVGAPVDITGVTTNELQIVEGTARVPSLVNIADTGSDIAQAVPALLANLGNLGAITVTSGIVTLTAAQALTANVADGASSLAALLPGHAYAVTGASIAQVGALASLAYAPASIAVSDTSANLASDLTAGFSQWAAHVSSVTVDGGTLFLTDAQAAFIGRQGISRVGDLHALQPGYTVEITGVPVSDLAAFAGYAESLQSGADLHLDAADTALALAQDLSSGHSVLQDAYSVTLTGAGGTLTPAQLTLVAGIADLNANGVTIPVSGGAAAIAGLSLGARTLAASIAVDDSAGNVQASLDALQSAYGGQLSVTLSDGSPNLTVSSATYTADQQTIDAITNPACVVVTGTAAAIAAIEPALAADSRVAQVQITDSALNVIGNLAAITALGSSATVTLNDPGSIPAAQALTLINANLAHLNTGDVVVADTGSQIAELAESGSAGQNFLLAHGAELTGDSSVALVDAEALANLGDAFNRNGHVLNVWDTAAHLTQGGAAAALAILTGSGPVTGIYLKTTANAVTLTAGNAVTLFGISGLNVDNPDGSVNLVTVSDTASHLDGAYAALQSEGGSIAYIVVDASATISYATLTDLQALHATTGGGVALTLSDSAANILAANAVNSPTIQASAWNLDTNADISVANAVALAALPNLSTGAFTLTVALGADTPVTVGQANNLAGLGTALVVTGHDLTVGGSVSALAGLSAGGASVAHVILSDTLANIANIAAGSPLLTGNIAVTDAESLTASQAMSFLSLMTASGVNANAVSFGGHVETVTDNVAALSALTSSAAWTSNPGLQAHFALVADDTASVLANPTNAAFLNSLSGQILAATSTVNAGTAGSLAALSDFSLGGHSLIVTDSAANLLAGPNSAGVALGTTVTLNASAALNAANAESLLQLGNFHLTQVLTITDSSANLLDGTLSGLIAGHAQVQVALAGPETLDAQTAAALTSLQGFADVTDMHIVDSSSYLLAPGASAAEQMAASVSLDGNEIVSANTVLRLSEVPHFISSGGTLILAGNDFADAPTLKAIADMGNHFSDGGYSLSLTQDDLSLTPVEFSALQNDGVLANGHLISAVLVDTGVSDIDNIMSLSATGVAGASVNIYGAAGSLISTTHESNAGFTVAAPDPGTGNGFSITEIVNGVESAPVVVLDASALENAVSGAAASFANSGQIQVDSGKYISLYTAGAQLPNAPSLVYDPHAHTISLDIPNSAPVTLITLGASTSPGTIDPTEILIKHHG